MKKLLILFALALTGSIHSQGNIMYGSLSGESFNGYYHIFGDKVNIRSAADKNSEVVKQLVIGDSIKVTKVTDIILDLNGMTYPWVQVEWTINKQKKTGFLWGGLFSFYHENFESESGVAYSIYLGPLKFDPEEGKLFGEARLLCNNVILDSRTFELNSFGKENQSFAMGIYKSPHYYVPAGYRYIEHIIWTGFTMEKCGPTGLVYVLVNDGKIIFSGTELGSYSAGDFSEGTEFVFPWDKGGMKEKIFEYYSSYQIGDDESTVYDTTYLLKTYTKVNGEFKLTKTHSKID